MMKSINRKKWLRITALLSAVIMVSSTAVIANSENEPVDSDRVKHHEVDIVALEFDPPTLVVRAGDTITWTNRDIVPHTATAADDSWDTGSLNVGEKATITVIENSMFNYYCRFHPGMKAKLVLTVN